MTSAQAKLKKSQENLQKAEKEVLYKEFKKKLNGTASRIQATRSSCRCWMWTFERENSKELGDEFMRRANIEDGYPEDEGIN